MQSLRFPVSFHWKWHFVVNWLAFVGFRCCVGGCKQDNFSQHFKRFKKNWNQSASIYRPKSYYNGAEIWISQGKFIIMWQWPVKCVSLYYTPVFVLYHCTIQRANVYFSILPIVVTIEPIIVIYDMFHAIMDYFYVCERRAVCLFVLQNTNSFADFRKMLRNWITSGLNLPYRTQFPGDTHTQIIYFLQFWPVRVYPLQWHRKVINKTNKFEKEHMNYNQINRSIVLSAFGSI